MSRRRSLQVSEDVFPSHKKAILYINVDNSNERTYHFKECESVLFHTSSGETVWTTSGDFTMPIPEGIGVRVIWGNMISATDAEAEKKTQGETKQ